MVLYIKNYQKAKRREKNQQLSNTDRHDVIDYWTFTKLLTVGVSIAEY